MRGCVLELDGGVCMSERVCSRARWRGVYECEAVFSC